MSKHTYLWNTVRGRMLLLAVAAELLMLTVLVANSLRLLQGSMTQQVKLDVEQIGPVLEAALAAPLAQRDYATVRAVVEESRAPGGIAYIVVTDAAGKRVAASGWPGGAPLPRPERGHTLAGLSLAPRHDVLSPITQSGQLLGTLHFGLNLSQIEHARNDLLVQGITIATVELALSSLLLFLIGYWITRHLGVLANTSLLVAAGNLAPPPVPEGIDDVGRLGVAFNTMARAIAERVEELTKAKDAAEQSERARAQSQERLQRVLDGSNDGFWDWDIPTGTVDFSRRWAAMLGFSLEELEPRISTWQALVHPDDLPRVEEALARHLDGRTALYETEQRVATKQGGWKWVLDRGKVVQRDADGNPLRAAGTHTDITDRKNAEDELKRANEGLEQRVRERTKALEEMHTQLALREKLATLGQLTAGIAHELNNPFNFVRTNFVSLAEYFGDLTEVLNGYRRLAPQGFPLDQLDALRAREEQLHLDTVLDDIPTLFDESRRGFDRVAAILRSMRDFSRSDGGDGFRPFNINKGIEDTLVIARDLYKYTADVVKDLGELPEIACLPEQLNQVFLNLLVNSAQALAERGGGEKGKIVIRTRHEGGFVCCDVADDGPGVPAALREKIFEPFFTTKPPGKGVGLGLSICYDIVVGKHDGELFLTCPEGGGSVFSLRLPTRHHLPGVSNDER